MGLQSLEELLEMTEPTDIKFVDVRPPKQAISMRLDPRAIDRAKRLARRHGVGYQTLFRMWIMDGLSRFETRETSIGNTAKPRAKRKPAA